MREKKYLLAGLLLMAIGFATVTTTVYINGTTSIKSNTNNFVDGVVFDEASISTLNNSTFTLLSTGRTLNVLINDFKKLGDKEVITYAIRNDSQYTATLDSIDCYFVDSYTDDTKSSVKSTTNDYVRIIPTSNFYPVTVNGGGEKTATTTLTVEQIKSYTGESNDTGKDYMTVKFQCEINASATESTTPGVTSAPSSSTKKYTVITGDGTQVGDEIAVGDEHFYVISNDGESINALAKYNLNVGSNAYGTATGIQNANALGVKSGVTKYGNVSFSNALNWIAEEDGIEAKATGTLHDALVSYQATLGEGITVRLITKAELEGLGCSSISNSCSGESSWVYSTSYWSGSAYSGDADYVWRIRSDGYMHYVDFSSDDYYGVRPVIEIET